MQSLDYELTQDSSQLRLVTRACTTILKKEVITLDFSPTAFYPYLIRQRILRHVLCIENCVCARCVNPASIGDFSDHLKCSQCKDGLVSAEEPTIWSESVWSCNSCQEEFPYSFIKKVLIDCRRELESIDTSRGRASADELMNFIRRRSLTDLHRGHFLMLSAYNKVETCLRSISAGVRQPDPATVYSRDNIQDFQRLGEYGDVVDRHVRTVRSHVDIFRGKFCLLRLLLSY